MQILSTNVNCLWVWQICLLYHNEQNSILLNSLIYDRWKNYHLSDLCRQLTQAVQKINFFMIKPFCRKIDNHQFFLIDKNSPILYTKTNFFIRFFTCIIIKTFPVTTRRLAQKLLVLRFLQPFSDIGCHLAAEVSHLVSLTKTSQESSKKIGFCEGSTNRRHRKN
jgi:hypothetical protein